ncbi:MAG: alpha-amylase family glycosyl hydrolase [Cyanobacteria bacterium J06638_22]
MQYPIRYNPEPDYTRSLLELSEDDRKRLLHYLTLLYGEEIAAETLPALTRQLRVHYAYKHPETIERDRAFEPKERFTEQDVILITYGDVLQSQDRTPLRTLADFLNASPTFKNIINTLHILPFFPSSSDRGFAVINFGAVDPQLGSWKDVEVLGQNFELMFDGVFNHISSSSQTFQEFLNGNPRFQEMFITYESPKGLTPEERETLVRPRTSDVLTQFQSMNGPVWVWTTFSADQVDLNFANPEVMLRIVTTLLRYVRYGANLIRLDAVTYLWKQPGTCCASLLQTHAIVKLFRRILGVVAPHAALITETNVPHTENVSYFGDGADEAQMVYNFALPPLVLYTFYQEDTSNLTDWAQSLDYPSPTTTFFNILDTHDGIGLMGVRDILSKDEINFMVQRARHHGAFISYRTIKGGQEEPYEINSTWFSALNLDDSLESLSYQVQRYVASRSIALVLRGVPGIYFHGLIGTCNDVASVIKTKVKRDMNRQTLQDSELMEALRDRQSQPSQVVQRLGQLLSIRRQYQAFHPNSGQYVLSLSPKLFSVLRRSLDDEQHILCLTNVTGEEVPIAIPMTELGVEDNQWYDLVGHSGWTADGHKLTGCLHPYGVAWLIPFSELERIVEDNLSS